MVSTLLLPEEHIAHHGFTNPGGEPMKLDLFFTLFCAAVIVFASAYTEVAHAQSLEDGLGGHWTFDRLIPMPKSLKMLSVKTMGRLRVPRKL